MDVSMEITDQQVALLGDILAKEHFDISHMLTEGFTKEYKVNLSPFSAWGAGDHHVDLRWGFFTYLHDIIGLALPPWFMQFVW